MLLTHASRLGGCLCFPYNSSYLCLISFISKWQGVVDMQKEDMNYSLITPLLRAPTKKLYCHWWSTNRNNLLWVTIWWYIQYLGVPNIHHNKASSFTSGSKSTEAYRWYGEQYDWDVSGHWPSLNCGEMRVLLFSVAPRQLFELYFSQNWTVRCIPLVLSCRPSGPGSAVLKAHLFLGTCILEHSQMKTQSHVLQLKNFTHFHMI